MIIVKDIIINEEKLYGLDYNFFNEYFINNDLVINKYLNKYIIYK